MREPWPDGTQYDGETGCGLWIECESSQALNLERAKNWGYSLEKIYTPFADPTVDVNLDNDNHRNAVLLKAQLPEVKIIGIDSLSGSTHKNERDEAMKPLVEFVARMARDTGKLVIATHHLRKRGLLDGEKINLDRVRGSSIITQYARVVWAMDKPNPYEDNQIRLQVIKNNLARFPQSLGMMIEENGITFMDAPEEPKNETVLDRAKELLLVLLDKEPIKQAEIEKNAKGAGISWRTIVSAKKALAIVSKKQTDGWYWSLPAKL